MCWQTFRNHNPCRCQTVEWIRGQEPRFAFRTREVWAHTSSDKAMKSEVTLLQPGWIFYLSVLAGLDQKVRGAWSLWLREWVEHLGDSCPKLGRCLWGKILVNKSHQNHSWRVYPPKSKNFKNNNSHITMVIFSLRFDILDSVPNALVRQNSLKCSFHHFKLGS